MFRLFNETILIFMNAVKVLISYKVIDFGHLFYSQQEFYR